MKTVYVVSKTHLDLGFTDYAKNIRQTYINTYIPNAISLAEEMNTDGKKRFVWTTGSWIIKEALENGTDEQKKNLEKALKNGNIIAHALPFTTHTELLDEDTLEYGLEIADRLDALRGRKTISAKMTDVPGHTKALVPLLAKHGIKLLHIGVNGASALCKVPPCFLWKCGDSEVVVIYSGDYGGAFSCDLIDEVLYFDHTLDNRGTPSANKILKKLDDIQSEYPEYEITAGSMDDIAEVLWEKRGSLPVITSELGDTWIHGSAADPYKSASLRELIALKNKWLADGTMARGSAEYTCLADAMLCLAEHTCGMDTKMHFADYENYLKKDFQSARKTDRVILRDPSKDPQSLIVQQKRESGEYKEGSYTVLEKSWQEQRKYIDLALSQLTVEHRAEAVGRLNMLRPTEPTEFENEFDIDTAVSVGEWELALNEHGGIKSLKSGDDEVIRDNNEPLIEYRSFDDNDYDFWLSHYTRNIKETFEWCIGDFARPLLKYVSGKYPSGRFAYKMQSAYTDGNTICVNLKCDEKLCSKLGAPRLIQAFYTLTECGLTLDVNWYGKDANRLTEAIYLHMFPNVEEDFSLRKINEWIDYSDIVPMGGKNLHAVRYAQLDKKYIFTNRHSPLISVGKGKILEYDNRVEDIKKDGISYVLYNNVWGTNFPLWYEDNAHFTFEITKENNKDD